MENKELTDCEKGMHIHKGFIWENPDMWECDFCGSIITKYEAQ